jgi:diguanylate cyclase
MNYSETCEQSSEFLRLVLKHLGQYDLPPNPLNYHLWYDHVAGHNRELSQAIELLVASGEAITPEICRSLYARHISETGKQVIDNVRNRIQLLLAEVLSQVLATGGDITRYSARLESFTERLLLDTDSSASLRELIQEILNETRSMENASTGFRSSLESISNEVESLRDDLEKARQQATTDALTGLANRRAFDAALA